MQHGEGLRHGERVVWHVVPWCGMVRHAVWRGTWMSSMSLGWSTGRSTLTLGRFMFLRSPIDWSFSMLHFTDVARHSTTRCPRQGPNA